MMVSCFFSFISFSMMSRMKCFLPVISWGGSTGVCLRWRRASTTSTSSAFNAVYLRRGAGGCSAAALTSSSGAKDRIAATDVSGYACHLYRDALDAVSPSNACVMRAHSRSLSPLSAACKHGELGGRSAGTLDAIDPEGCRDT